MRTNLQSHLVEKRPANIQKLEKFFSVLELNRTKTYVKDLNKLNREHMAKTNSEKKIFHFKLVERNRSFHGLRSPGPYFLGTIVVQVLLLYVTRFESIAKLPLPHVQTSHAAHMNETMLHI